MASGPPERRRTPGSSARREPGAALLVRPMALRDVDQVLAIEQAVFPSPWSRASFERECREECSSSWVVVVGESVAGYAVSWIVCDEVHIGNIAVDPRLQGRGIGRLLLARILDDATDRGSVLATLEARESNHRALRLYERFAFRPVAIRKRYYADSGEDAIVMIADLEQRRDE
jgi:ribosomal-protein-alanine N-acetyltransferase